MRKTDTFRLEDLVELKDLLSFEVVKRNFVENSPFCSISSSRFYIISLGGNLEGE